MFRLREEIMSFRQDKNGLYKPLSDGQVLRVQTNGFNTLLSLSSSQEDDGWKQGWYYESQQDAINDFVMWEPGDYVTCALCDFERGGDDPPGPWIRHLPSNRRRIRIFGEYHGLLGYFTLVRP
jgi:hypothetical protein